MTDSSFQTATATLSREELLALKGKLSRLRTMQKKLGKRGITHYFEETRGVSVVRIESGVDLPKEAILTIVQSLEAFRDIGSDAEVRYTPKLKGGIRIIRDGNMTDLSFSHVEKALLG